MRFDLPKAMDQVKEHHEQYHYWKGVMDVLKDLNTHTEPPILEFSYAEEAPEPLHLVQDIQKLRGPRGPHGKGAGTREDFNRKLTPETAGEIKWYLKNTSTTLETLARMYGCSRCNIQHIQAGRNWIAAKIRRPKVPLIN